MYPGKSEKVTVQPKGGEKMPSGISVKTRLCSPALTRPICSHRQGAGQLRPTYLHTSGKANYLRLKGAQSKGRLRVPGGSACPVDLIVYEDRKPSLRATLPDLCEALVPASLIETNPTHVHMAFSF